MSDLPPDLDFEVPQDRPQPPVRPKKTHRPRLKASTVGAAALVVLVLIAMVGGAFAVSQLLTAGPSSCSGMASDAAAETIAADREIEIIVGLAGNTDAVGAEAGTMVTSALAIDEPATATRVKVTLVNGDIEYRPTDGEAADCIGSDLLVAPTAADLEAYEKADGGAKTDIEESLAEQYRNEVQIVASAVEESIKQAPSPESGDGGAFSIWPFVAQAEQSRELHVLSTFAVGGDNCLTLDRPNGLSDEGRSLIDARIDECVSLGEVPVVEAASVRLQVVASLQLSGAQREAQSSTVTALCSGAVSNGCA